MSSVTFLGFFGSSNLDGALCRVDTRLDSGCRRVIRSSCHPERSEPAGERSRRISPEAKACGGRGSSSIGMCAAQPGCVDWAGKGFRPAEKRQSRADGQVCPSARSLMVRAPASSPYETSTNRQDAGLGAPLVRHGRAACGRANPAAIGAGFVRLAAGWARLQPAGALRARGRDRPLRRCGRSAPPVVKNSILRRVENAEGPLDGRKFRFAKVEKRISGVFLTPRRAKPQLAAPVPVGGTVLFRFPPFAKRNF